MSEVAPALTPEDRKAIDGLFSHLSLRYDQPGGFTWEMVDTLNKAIHYDPTTGKHGMALEAVRDRIAALLPPREDSP